MPCIRGCWRRRIPCLHRRSKRSRPTALSSPSAFGVKAVVMTSRHSPEATGVLAKSASGALEYVPIAEVGNLARALETLKARGFLLIGLDSSGTAELEALSLASPLALVLGA